MEKECAKSSQPCPRKVSENITSKFQEAVKDLKLGELLHDDLFGLFEAMSAIEMMDPKMDAGMLCNRGSRKIISFDQAVQDKMLKLDEFSNAELIGIIDSTLACLVSWLEGHSLAQTLFINLYLHKPYMIEDRPLRVFCLAIYKLLEEIKDLVHNGMVYEEEDFQPMQYGYHLNPDISQQRMIGMLREVEEDLYRKNRSNPEPETHALFARIKFLRLFLQVLMSMFKKDEQPVISECNRLLANCLDMLHIMQKTMHMGIISKDSDSEYILGFEPSINQRLLPPTFPRYTKIKSRYGAIGYFIDVAERFKIVTKITTITSLHHAMDFFIDFSKTSPCILSRSALQMMYPGSTGNLKDILKESVKSFISPPALISKTLLNNSQAKHYVDTFLSHCTRPFTLFLQLCGHNRARQRDKLAHILEDFASLQDEALMGFRLEGKLTIPNPRFDSEQVRYEHRFAPFQNLLTPPPVVYSEFREMTSFERFQQQPVDSVFLYIAGCKHFHQARQLLESIVPDSELTDLLTICKTNFIVLKLLAGGHKKDSTKPPEFDFSKNKYFATMKIV
ncbi:N-alpha-acetyltransferase 35, NatC auxiliary subunit-like isoform X3 [Diabrotica undecimpunctata]|uniref:N-alpha-acetyltransferase 35, NatC auxiliary subunit-like isoform X3 n=1 Tax=Diabrotica undecimpunctata TaxID=50387 RepID=UPI003B63D9EE